MRNGCDLGPSSFAKYGDADNGKWACPESSPSEATKTTILTKLMSLIQAPSAFGCAKQSERVWRSHGDTTAQRTTSLSCSYSAHNSLRLKVDDTDGYEGFEERIWSALRRTKEQAERGVVDRSRLLQIDASVGSYRTARSMLCWTRSPVSVTRWTRRARRQMVDGGTRQPIQFMRQKTNSNTECTRPVKAKMKL